jgi:hypothetical protein
MHIADDSPAVLETTQPELLPPALCSQKGRYGIPVVGGI